MKKVKEEKSLSFDKLTGLQTRRWNVSSLIVYQTIWIEMKRRNYSLPFDTQTTEKWARIREGSGIQFSNTKIRASIGSVR